MVVYTRVYLLVVYTRVYLRVYIPTMVPGRHKGDYIPTMVPGRHKGGIYRVVYTSGCVGRAYTEWCIPQGVPQGVYRVVYHRVYLRVYLRVVYREAGRPLRRVVPASLSARSCQKRAESDQETRYRERPRTRTE